MLTKNQIQNLIKIWKQEFKVELDKEEATKVGNILFTYFSKLDQAYRDNILIINNSDNGNTNVTK